MRSFGSVLDEAKGRGPGFDTLRICLSVAILCFHAQSISTGSAANWDGPARYGAALLIPAFFAVSGFLVMGSALRLNSLVTFLTFRILRIVPALLTEVFVTAFVLGGLITELSPAEYFTSLELYTYFQNIIGHVHFHLPGVFAKNPDSTVNASLWTIQPELFCYVFLALAILSRLYRHVALYTGAALIIFVLMIINDVAFSKGPNDIGVAAQERAFLFFVAGSVAYLFRFKIPFNALLATTAVAISIPLLQAPGFAVLAAIPVVYCVIYVGLSRLPTTQLFSSGDYSYGIYLYAYPIQQTIVALSPIQYRLWYVNILLALPIVVAIAALSWHFVERPFLTLKQHIQIEDARLLRAYLPRFAITFGLGFYALILINWTGALGSGHRETVIYSAAGIAVASLLVAAIGRNHFRGPTVMPAQ